MTEILFQKFYFKITSRWQKYDSFLLGLTEFHSILCWKYNFVGRFHNRICIVSNHHISRIGMKIKPYNDRYEETGAAIADSCNSKYEERQGDYTDKTQKLFKTIRNGVIKYQFL